MKPTDEDVEVIARVLVSNQGAGFDGLRSISKQVWRDHARAALEAYTPRLIERLAREADEVSATIEYGDSEDGGVFEPLSNWLRSHLEKNHD